MAKTAVAAGDPGDWFALILILISLGILPGKWKGTVSGAATLYWIWKRFGE
ncbi:MAG TPA: hypothetical protein VME70_06030 [Mycobacteriales bacterium]|nr:hypothetical protein [Mycobacteriales bacterium]